MRNASAEFKAAMASNTAFKEHAEITLSDNTMLELGPGDFTVSGNYVVDGPGLSSFPLGVAVQRQAQLQIMNADGSFSDVDFLNAGVRLYLTLGNEELGLGYFTATTPATYGDTITVTVYDDMYKADKEYAAGITFPATAAALFADVCSCCGITAGGTFKNSTFTVNATPPSGMTCREVLGGIGLIAAGNVHIDDSGVAQVISYTTTSTPPELSLWQTISVEIADTVITGLSTEGATGSVQVGSGDYILPVSCAAFPTQEQDILTLIGVDLLGLTFRVFTGEHIADPLVEFMDYVSVKDRKGVSHRTFITDAQFQFCNFTSLKNSAATSVDNGRTYGSVQRTVNNIRSQVQQLDYEISSKVWQTDIDEAVATRVRTYIQGLTRSTDRALVTRDGRPIYTRDGHPIHAVTWEQPIAGYNIDVDEFGAGDLWFNTDEGNKLYRWNGTAWETVQDKDIDAAKLAISEITQRVDSITLRVVGSDGTVSEVQLNDQGQINLLGSVIAERIMAEDITATGSFQVDNGSWQLLVDDTGFYLRRVTSQNSYAYLTSKELTFTTEQMGVTGTVPPYVDVGYFNTMSLCAGATTLATGLDSKLYVQGDTIFLQGSPNGTAARDCIVDVQGSMNPNVTTAFSLGATSLRWNYIYLSHNPNVSSDRNLKRDISESVPDIVDRLTPVRYKRKNGPDVVHYGFVAQDVEDALKQVGIDTDNIGLVTFETDAEGDKTNYALSYEEFIPLLVDKVKKQQDEIDGLTRRIEALERSINNG